MNTYEKPSSIVPHDDEERLRKLYLYEILDTHPEEAFDKVAKLAAQIFDTPSAFVSFVDKDRVFFKANISNLDGKEVLREESLCSLAILEEQMTVFNDTHQVPDLLENPYVTCQGGIRFYAGAPLKTSEGHRLGTVCVVDEVPRQASAKQMQMLETLASIVIDELEHRLNARKAARAQQDLLSMMAHELKNPANNITLLSELMPRYAGDGQKIEELSAKMKLSAETVIQRLSEILHMAQVEDDAFRLNLETASLVEILERVRDNFKYPAQQKGQQIHLACDEAVEIVADKSRIQEVFENLLSNAIKYSYPDTEIYIAVQKEKQAAVVEFRDQGQGLSEADMKKLFTKFARLSAIPTGKERSSGLGLSIVKTLVELHQGKVWAESRGKEKGASFYVSLPLVSS